MPRIVTTPPGEQATDEGVVVGGWWRESEDTQRILCGLCPRACSLGPGKRGFCFVRENRGGQMVSTTYGRSTGFCVDPIEKKPLNHFYPGSAVLSFGTAGCNLGCKFCQNWTMSRSRDVDASCAEAAPETIANAARQLGCRSVALTYNDPIVWAEYAVDTARACHEMGVKTVAVTSGYITPEARGDFYRDIDAANVDLKGFTEDFYDKLTGGHLEPVLDTLRWLVQETDVWLEITNLVIPDANDSPDELQRMCDWIAEELGVEVPIHFSAFHPDFKLTDRPRTPPETLLRAYEIAQRAGLHYVYTGNVVDRDRQSTYCFRCERRVIERNGYDIGLFEIHEGRCTYCEAPIAGHYDAVPGDWSGKRLPVNIMQYTVEPRTRQTSQEAEMTEKRTEPSKHIDDATRPQLTKSQESLIFRTAGQCVTAAVVPDRTGAVDAGVVLDEIAAMPLYGAFVSLKRSGQLRSCCGMLGQSIPLSDALDKAAFRAATDDPRFPPVSPTELEHLDMEVWLLWAPQPVETKGEDRMNAFTIGKHGLQVAKGNRRGLLLPGVAVDHKLDAPGFLKQVCLKAGLPADAWKQDDTQLMTFEGYAIRGRLETTMDESTTKVVSSTDTPEVPPGGPSREQVAALARFARQNTLALAQGATPSYYMPGGYDGGVNGLALALGDMATEGAIVCSKLSLRPEMPLQSTLFSMTEAAARSISARRIPWDELQKAPVDLCVMFDPAMHGTIGRPTLGGLVSGQRAVLVMDQSHSAWVFDPKLTPDELLTEATKQARLEDRPEARVMSLAVVCSAPRMTVANVPRPQPGPDIRPAAVAGMFYPETAEEVRRSLDDMLPKDRPRESWPAAMVPHAGWVYSGHLAAEVFSRLEIPEQVIILCPKHRAGGADWAVAPHQTWSLPTGEMLSDPGLARHLAATIDGLELDAISHRQEHAIEVQLPILQRMAPNARVVGITIGGGDWPRLKQFAQQLADVLRDMPRRPLLIISSDLNHFSDDATTRRVDRMALDAMETLDPQKLFETVRGNQISMCGVLPAVIVMETLRQLEGLHRYKEVGYASSAEASGDTSRVVGYAGVLLG